MCGLRIIVLGLLCTTLAARPAVAQQPGVRWHHDLEAATALAHQTGRLVLVHFWTPSCAPCRALDNYVFSQAAVASALEARFVPVKLNANDSQAEARRFGITRVPTDVIISPQGQLLGKLVSPSTPTAYISEITQVANRSHAYPGLSLQPTFASTASNSQLNSAYADLVFGPPAQGTASTPQVAPAVPWPAQPVNRASTTQATEIGYPMESSSIAVGTQDVPYQSFASVASTTAPPQLPMSQLDKQQPPMEAGRERSQPAPAMVTNEYVSSSNHPPQPTLPSTAGAIPAVSREVSDPSAVTIASDPAAAVTEPVSARRPVSPQLPPGSPPLAFDGYCPVTMRNEWIWKPGNVNWGAYHRGRTYLFADESARDSFLTDPDRYSPVLSGADPVVAIDQKRTVAGQCDFSLEYDGRFYLFSSETTLQQFATDPERYVTRIRQTIGLNPGSSVR